MSGRKTIMVDGGVWNKVEELKHNACLRSSSDAIETAVDIASSDKYYAGIKAQIDGFGRIAYVVESLGRSEDEAIRNLLTFEQGSILGDLRAEDIPPADDVDISEPGYFIVECTNRLYHAGKLFADPEHWHERSSMFWLLDCLFTCTISKSKNGSFIADSEETNNRIYETGDRYFVLVQMMDDNKTARIIDYGTSPIELHNEIIAMDYDNDDPYNDYNAYKYQIYPCSTRLYAECVGNKFQSRSDLHAIAEGGDVDDLDESAYQAFYGCARYRENKTTGKEEEYIDTTPEGHYYALLVNTPGKAKHLLFSAGETANKASKPFLCPIPTFDDYIDAENHIHYITKIPVWSEVNKNGERSGKYTLPNGEEVELTIVECTKELYCKYLMEKEVCTLECKIETENGVKIAKYVGTLKEAFKENPASKKTNAAKTTKAKKTGGKK